MTQPLETWKEVAAFLGSIGGPKSERMARYLGDEGMPVYQGSAGGRVRADRDEIRMWWKARLRHVGSRHVSEWCRRLPRGRGKSVKRQAE